MNNTKMQLELGFDFTKTLFDADGDTLVVPTDFKKEITISSFLHCGKKQALKVLADLEKEYDVYCNWGQIVLAKGDKAIYNFESFGQTWWHGHKYNIVDEWDFRNFVEGKKIKIEKRKSTRTKDIVLTVTEIQRKRAQQLWYAHTIGFDISYKDYQRFFLVP